MTLIRSKLKPVVTAIAIYAAVFAGASAQMGPSEAPPEAGTAQEALLGKLASARPADAQRIDKQLRQLWSKSGSAAMDLLLRRGAEAMAAGDLDAAIEHLSALTDHAPDFAEGWHLRASAFHEAKLYGPAIADLERALALNPKNYHAIFGLAVILEEFADHRRALAAYRMVQALNPHRAGLVEALERLGAKVEGRRL